MLKFFKSGLCLGAAVTLLTLAGCGGGGGANGTSTLGTGSSTGTGTGTGTGTSTPTAADISVALSATSVQNTGSTTSVVTVTAVDANRNTVQGIPVTLRVDSDATVQVSGSSTDSKGVVTGTVGIGANRANRVITITAISGNLSKEVLLRVVGTKFTATALPAVLSPGAAGKVQYKVEDAAGGALVGADVVVTGPSGAQSTGKTDANGAYEYSYTAPATSGTLSIRAAAAGVDQISTVVVQSAAGAIPPATQTVRSASVSANPSVVAVNTAATTSSNRSEVRALFVGDSNLPVTNVRVRFDLNGDANSIGGSFSTGSSLVYSDANGIARSAYIPGSRFSPTDGVTVRACWSPSDFAVGTCPNQATAKLTVVSDALSVSIGTDNLVVIGDLVYSQRYVIQVNDSSGVAVADALISPLLDLSSYAKGFWYRPAQGDSWLKQTDEATCDNEDINRNGVIEVYSNGVREDANSNGQLDPRKADAVVSYEGSNRTNSVGQVIVRITYPKNVGSWVDYTIEVAAAGVAGTEGRARFVGKLGVPIADVKNEGAPPFIVSPYGTGAGNPTGLITFTGQILQLCTR